MNSPSLVLYFGSRVISAAGNLASVALFARMVGPAEYGAYILMFAWAILVYGFATQWMKFSYFGVYRAAHEDKIIVSYIRLATAAMLAACLIAGTAALIRPDDAEFILALVALFIGMTIYEAALEISRTRLQVTAVAFSMICRAVFVLALGYLSLQIHHSAISLALGVSAGHLLGAIPTLGKLRSLPLLSPLTDGYKSIIRYGWPLIFSFGILAIGQTIDRFLIAKYAGNAILGPYGVVADMMRQSFLVVGESIALALITVAKRHADEGRRDDSDAVMRSTFHACLLAGSFGAAFFIIFGNEITRILLGPDFTAVARDVIPLFAIAFGFMTLRAFYFGQVIYFASSTLFELLIASTFVLSSGILALILVPGHGAFGGALALMVAHVFSCLISALLGRRLYPFPVNVAALIAIPAMAAIAIVLSEALADILGTGIFTLIGQAAVLLGAAGLTAWKFDLLALLTVRREPPAHA